MDVMTDLTKVAAVAIDPRASLEQAEQRMITAGVRLLFVINQYQHVTGIITSRDLDGDRVMARLSEAGVRRQDLTVREIMTPQHHVEVLEMGDVATSRVGDLVATLKGMGRQHALVVEADRSGKQSIRGVLSTTQISKQLGESIDTSDRAGSFAGLAAIT
jgi:signal-transduction protein with cAMP-binding, CBS, and nucleotidyltransferase domain